MIVKPKVWTNYKIGGYKYCGFENLTINFVLDGKYMDQNVIISLKTHRMINGGGKE